MQEKGKIFIVGNSRSGTTMLGRMFGAHSDVYTFEELHFFEQMVDADAIRNGSHWSRDKLSRMVERLLTSASKNIFLQVAQGKHTDEANQIIDMAASDDPVDVYTTFLQKITKDNSKTIPCEQTPRYLYLVDELMERYPDALFICMIRDPRAVLLSQKNKWRRRTIGKENMPLYWSIRAWINYHPYSTTLLWASASKRARRFQDHPRFQTVKFETLAQAPEQTMEELCSFLGLTYESEMLQVTQIGSSTGTDRPDVKGVDASRIGAWRNGGLSNVEIALCDRTAGKELMAWGYTPSGKKGTAFALGLSMLGFIFKTTVALLMNLRRNKNIIQTIRRRLT